VPCRTCRRHHSDPPGTRPVPASRLASPKLRSDLSNPRTKVRRFDHVGITIAALDKAAAFLVGLALMSRAQVFLEGAFVDTVIASPTPEAESSCCARPSEAAACSCPASSDPMTSPGVPAAMFNELGLRHLGFEV
jgi:hypothetical protein